MTATGQSSTPPPYGIVFNWDGTPHGYSEHPQSLQQLLDKVYAPIENTQVGALFWCLGAEEAKWPSASLPVIGDAENRRYGSTKHMRRAEGVRAFFDRGDDLYPALVARGRELGIQVYCSIRINDNHFWSDGARREPPLRPEEMASVTRPHLTPLRKEHPEWCLGIDRAPRWAATSWNIAIPEVREYRLRYIAEACRLADWDGVELDWQRHAFHLPEDDAYRLRYTLTDLQRAVRGLADEIAAARGRPFFVGVRVGAALETCRRVGYDLETWMRDGLCDLVATNANSGTDPGVEIETYLELAREREIPLYPGLDSHGESGQGHLIGASTWREAWYRGLAQGFLARGASGIYIFNWHATRDSHRSLLTTLGALKTLRRRDKVYAAIKRHIRDRSELRYGAERDDRLYGEVPVALYSTSTGTGPLFHVAVHDRAADARKVTLYIELAHFTPTDQIAVALDGRRLDAPEVRSTASADPDNPANITENSWLGWPLAPAQVDRGMREIQVSLVARNPHLQPPLVVENVEIHIDY